MTINQLKANPILSALLAGGITVPVLLAGAAWAVDARIEQKTHMQMQQLRIDIVRDFEKRRIDYLQMKKNAQIINDDERIELEYLKGQQDDAATP